MVLVAMKIFPELGALGNSSGSPFLHSDSDILLDSPDRKDIGKKGNCHFLKYTSLLLTLMRFREIKVLI